MYISSPRNSVPQIDLAAHVGGALSGALVAYLWGPRYVWPGTPGDTRKHLASEDIGFETLENHRKAIGKLGIISIQTKIKKKIHI